MIPETSPLYKHSLETAPASISRSPGSLKPGAPEGALKICYRKYRSTTPQGKQPLNLVFVHGTGMNKGLWHYHIDQLFKQCKEIGIFLNVVVALDAVNHGRSAEINRKFLGNTASWRDTAYDVIRIVEQEKEVFFAPNAKNIIVGHSMGGFVSLYACYLHPGLFDCCIGINPVLYLKKLQVGDTPPFLTWKERGYMETEFDIPEGELWRNVVTGYFKKKSFYRAFKDEVLQNMLEDEVPENLDLNTSHVLLNTTQADTIFTYLSGGFAIPTSNGFLPHVRVPVFQLLSEFDTADTTSRIQVLQDLDGYIETTTFSGEKHLVNGEKPDLVVGEIMRILKLRANAPPNESMAIDPFPQEKGKL